jgi:hypothetical protein
MIIWGSFYEKKVKRKLGILYRTGCSGYEQDSWHLPSFQHCFKGSLFTLLYIFTLLSQLYNSSAP